MQPASTPTQVPSEPTSPGWWWFKSMREWVPREVFLYEGVLRTSVPGNNDLPCSQLCGEWGGPCTRSNLGNQTAREGHDRCDCGCKYWENDHCVDCGTKHDPEKFRPEPENWHAAREAINRRIEKGWDDEHGVPPAAPTNEHTAWQRFRGLGTGRITDAELRELFQETKAALPFLDNNRNELGRLASGEARRILSQLADYARARGMRGNFKF